MLCLLVALPAWAQSDQNLAVDKILDKVEARYSRAGFSADFEQTSTLEALGLTDTASGQARFKRPDKIRWEYHRPQVQQIISDGILLWVYKPDENQVMVGKAPVFFTKGSGASFLSDISSLRKNFEVTFSDQREREDCYTLKMDWTQEGLDIAEIYLFISRQTFDIAAVETSTEYGDTTLIEFNNISFEEELDDTLFVFDIPIDADIIALGD